MTRDDSYTPFGGGQRSAPPRLELIAECWRVVGPNGKPIICSIYQATTGVEVRCEYSPQHLTSVDYLEMTEPAVRHLFDGIQRFVDLISQVD